MTFLLVATALFGIAACDDDDNGTGIEGNGTVSVVLTDSEDGSASVIPGRQATVAAAQRVTGEFRGEIAVEISADGESWVSVGSPQQASVALQSGERTTVQGASEVQGGEYAHIRLTLDGARADVDAGVELGGSILDAAVTLTLAGGSEIMVEKSVFAFVVDESRSMEIVVDVNSDAWITAANADDGTVSEAEVRSAVRLEAVRK